MGDFFLRRGNDKRRLINEEDEVEGGERGAGGHLSPPKPAYGAVTIPGGRCPGLSFCFIELNCHFVPHSVVSLLWSNL